MIDEIGELTRHIEVCVFLNSRQTLSDFLFSDVENPDRNSRLPRQQGVGVSIFGPVRANWCSALRWLTRCV